MVYQSSTQLMSSLDATMVVLGVVSLVLNCFLLHVVYHSIKSKPERNGVRFDHQLVIAMALAGITSSIGSLAVYVVRLVLGSGGVVKVSSTYCAVSGLIDGVLSGQAGIFACLLAVEWFRKAVMGVSLDPRRGRTALIIPSLALWTIFHANSVYGSYTFDTTTTLCLPHGNSFVPRMARFAIDLQFISPFLLFSFCYTPTAMVCFINSVKSTNRKNRSNWITIAVRAFTVNLIYCACYAPAVALHALHLITGTHFLGLAITRQVTASLAVLVHPIMALYFNNKFNDYTRSLFQFSK